MPIQSRLLRRRFLKGCSFAGAAVRLGLPQLETMFNSNGTAYAAEATRNGLAQGTAALPPVIGEGLRKADPGSDLKDYPRIAKLQSDLLVHALATRQTRVAGVDPSRIRLHAAGPRKDRHPLWQRVAETS